MAREVYFDPFGAYTRGRQAGVADEMSVQQGARQARASDWDYYNMAPLRLNEARRNDEVGAAGQPYRLDLLPVGYRNAIADSVAKQVEAYYPLTQLGVADPMARAIETIPGYNVTGNQQQGYQYTGPNGQPVSGTLTLEDYLRSSPAFRKEGYDRSDTQFNQSLQGRQLMNEDLRTQYYGRQVEGQIDAQAYNAYDNAYGGRGGAGGAQPQYDNTWTVAPGTQNHALLFGGNVTPAQQPQQNTPYYINGGIPGIGAPMIQPEPVMTPANPDAALPQFPHIVFPPGVDRIQYMQTYFPTEYDILMQQSAPVQ